VGTAGAELSPELKAAIMLFHSSLDERHRRLYAGLEAQKLGHGGDRKIAEFLGVDVHTVARGRRELLGGAVEGERVRQAGGGRKKVEKKKPEVMAEMERLLEPIPLATPSAVCDGPVAPQPRLRHNCYDCAFG